MRRDSSFQRLSAFGHPVLCSLFFLPVGLLITGFAGNTCQADITVTDSDSGVVYQNFKSTSDFSAEHYQSNGGVIDALDSDHWLVWVQVLSESKPPEIDSLFHLNALDYQQSAANSGMWELSFAGHHFDVTLDYSLVGGELVSSLSVDHSVDAFLPELFHQADLKIYNVFDYDSPNGSEVLDFSTSHFSFSDPSYPDFQVDRQLNAAADYVAFNVDFNSIDGSNLISGAPMNDGSGAFQWDVSLDAGGSFSTGSGTFVAVPEPGSVLGLFLAGSVFFARQRRR